MWFAQLRPQVYTYQKHRKSPIFHRTGEWGTGWLWSSQRCARDHLHPLMRTDGLVHLFQIQWSGCTLVAWNQSLWEFLYNRNWHMLQTRMWLLNINQHTAGHHNHWVTNWETEVWIWLWSDYDLFSLKCNIHCQILRVGWGGTFKRWFSLHSQEQINWSQTWWHTSVTLGLGSLRVESHEFRAAWDTHQVQDCPSL